MVTCGRLESRGCQTEGWDGLQTAHAAWRVAASDGRAIGGETCGSAVAGDGCISVAAASDGGGSAAAEYAPDDMRLAAVFARMNWNKCQSELRCKSHMGCSQCGAWASYKCCWCQKTLCRHDYCYQQCRAGHCQFHGCHTCNLAHKCSYYEKQEGRSSYSSDDDPEDWPAM